MYITDTAQWILWIQSAQDLSKVWAWEMNLDELGGIQPFCDAIRNDGWYLTVTSTLRMHIRDWEEINASAGMQYTQLASDTNVCFIKQDALMQQIINSHRIDQTN